MKVSAVSNVSQVSSISTTPSIGNVTQNTYENLLIRRSRLTQMIDELKPVSLESINEIKFVKNRNAVVVDISNGAKQSKYWNDNNISYPIINIDVQAYTRDLQFVYKSNY